MKGRHQEGQRSGDRPRRKALFGLLAAGLAGEGSWYTLEVPLSRCGMEGPWGSRSDGTPRRGRIPTPSCP